MSTTPGQSANPFDLGGFFTSVFNNLTGTGQKAPGQDQAEQTRKVLVQSLLNSGSSTTPQQWVEAINKYGDVSQRQGQQNAQFTSNLTLDNAGRMVPLVGQVQGIRTDAANKQAMGQAEADALRYKARTEGQLPILERAIQGEQWQAANQSGDFRYGVDRFYQDRDASRAYNTELLNSRKTGNLINRLIGGGLALASFFG